MKQLQQHEINNFAVKCPMNLVRITSQLLRTGNNTSDNVSQFFANSNFEYLLITLKAIHTS